MLEVGSEIEVRETPTGQARSYTIRGRRGQGGMGFIYTLSSSDGRPVVLKVPGKAGVMGGEIERRILQKLTPHRNVVRLVGTANVQGVDCAVLSYAHENPFRRINRADVTDSVAIFRPSDAPRVSLPATTAVEMVQEVLAALEHMHQSGYVHGDLKAQNVMVELGTSRTALTHKEYFSAIQQRAYRTILIDFGTTRSTGYLKTMGERDEAIVPPELTPLYAPPEILRGVGESRGGPGVDVYQVGMLFYELLTGHFPYDHIVPGISRDGLSATLLELKHAELQGSRRAFDTNRILAARQHDVVFAEAFAAERLRDRFYENVRAVIDAATAPDPAKRPSASSLRKDFIRIFELEAPTSPPQGNRVQVSMSNPRWHLVRANRLDAAARVPGPPELESDTVKTSLRVEPAPVPASPPVPRPDPAGFKVALVDDDRVTLTILASTLRRRGYRVRAFQDPESALDVLSRDHPDVAIFDMNMPAFTGIELVKRLEQRIRAQPFPIMILSSEGDEKILAEAYHHGVTDYLVKPVGEAELVVKIEQAHARQRARPPEQIPRELAGYELTEEVRRGEVAILFRAVNPEEPELVRAAKILRPDLAGEAEPLLRLRREIDVISRCDHPGIARVLESGLIGRLLFYVSDEVPSRTLGERVRERGRLSPGETVALLRDVGSALRHLHGRLIFHGDLTPESIGQTESGLTVIAEMGSARWLDGALRDDEALPLASRYTAPELRAAPSRPDPRSDLYALGVCALEATTGKPTQQLAAGGIDPRPLASVTPPELATVIERLLARSPEDRYPSASDLLQALSAISIH
jgi:serine/threonine protein kinase